MRWGRKIAAQPALAPYIDHEQLPGTAVETDADMLAFIRESGSTIYHPVGTCRMGQDPATSVVDPQLEVHGLEHLFIADASVFASLITVNINAAVMMVAEKAADCILNSRA